MALTRWPDRHASATIAATSSVLDGVRTAVGTQVWFFAQLRTVLFAAIVASGFEITSADGSADRGRGPADATAVPAVPRASDQVELRLLRPAGLNSVATKKPYTRCQTRMANGSFHPASVLEVAIVGGTTIAPTGCDDQLSADPRAIHRVGSDSGR